MMQILFFFANNPSKLCIYILFSLLTLHYTLPSFLNSWANTNYQIPNIQVIFLLILSNDTK